MSHSVCVCVCWCVYVSLVSSVFMQNKKLGPWSDKVSHITAKQSTNIWFWDNFKQEIAYAVTKPWFIVDQHCIISQFHEHIYSLRCCCCIFHPWPELLLWNLHVYLTGRSSVSLRTGALLHLQSTFVTGGLRNGNVHLDVWDTNKHTQKKHIMINTRYI